MESSSPFPSTVAAAYQADVAAGAQLGDRDYEWPAIATMVEQAAGAPAANRRDQLQAAADAAGRSVGRDLIAGHARIEWQNERHAISSLLVLSVVIQEAGGVHLAARLLDNALRAAEPLPILWKGRALALRARADWKLGRLDEAAERYDFIYDLGKRAAEPELMARAEIGRAALSQLRGNLPALREHSLKAAALADEAGARGVSRLAHQGLTIVAEQMGNHAEAVAAGLRVLEMSSGYPEFEAEALQNLGQVLLIAGESQTAKACFTAVLANPAPDRILLTALGALALASARLREEPTVEWCVREVWRANGIAVPRYELANALLESGMALQIVGRTEEAERYRGAAQRLAAQHEFHELVFNAEQLARQTERARSGRLDSQAVARRARELGHRLPRRVAFEA